MGVCWGCVERTPRQLQLSAEGRRGMKRYTSAILATEASKEGAKHHEPVTKIQGQYVRNPRYERCFCSLEPCSSQGT